MTEAERKFGAEVLRLAADRFSNHGCNDFYIPDTPENREFAFAVARHHGWTDAEDVTQISNGQICLGDWEVMEYIAHKMDPLPHEE